jgi:hypothetical protein
MGKDVEGCDRGLIEALSQHFLTGSEESQERPQIRVASVPAKIRLEHLQNTNLGPQCSRSLNVTGASMLQEPQCYRGLNVPGTSMFQGPQCYRSLNVPGASMLQEPQCSRSLNVTGASMFQEPQCSRGLNVPGASMFQEPQCSRSLTGAGESYVTHIVHFCKVASYTTNQG